MSSSFQAEFLLFISFAKKSTKDNGSCKTNEENEKEMLRNVHKERKVLLMAIELPDDDLKVDVNHIVSDPRVKIMKPQLYKGTSQAYHRLKQRN